MILLPKHVCEAKQSKLLNFQYMCKLLQHIVTVSDKESLKKRFMVSHLLVKQGGCSSKCFETKQWGHGAIFSTLVTCPLHSATNPSNQTPATDIPQ